LLILLPQELWSVSREIGGFVQLLIVVTGLLSMLHVNKDP
jgi:hypothetical protein